MDNFTEMQKKFFEMWQNSFKPNNYKYFDLSSIQRDMFTPYFQIDKGTQVYTDLFSFYKNFNDAFFKRENKLDVFDYQNLFKNFQKNYNDIVLKIFNLSDLTPEKVFNDFTKPFSDMNIYNNLKFFIENSESNLGVLNNFSKVNFEFFDDMLKLPSIGLTREYNDMIKNIVEDFKAYMGNVEKFKAIINKESEKGFQDFINEIIKHPNIENFDEFFKKWVNKNESVFHSFFKSKDFGSTLGELVKAGSKLKLSLDRYTYEVLKDSNIATKTELDRAYKELYIVKQDNQEIRKEIKELKDIIKTLKGEVPTDAKAKSVKKTKMEE